MRVVLDTNILVSGTFWIGDSHKVLVSWKEEKFTLITSIDAILEIVKVLKDFKIRLPDDTIRGLVDLIVINSIIVNPKEKINVVKDDPKDNLFVEAAIAGDADYLISQDKHLLRLKEIRGIKIITPPEFNKICN